MNRDKLRKKLEAQTARDSTHMRQWSRRRHDRIVRLKEEPILPRLCKLCNIAMWASAAAAVSHDVYTFYAYPHTYELSRMLRNAAFSGLACWLLFAAVLIPCCIAQLRRGFDDPYFNRFRVPKKGRPRPPVAKRYIRWAIVAGIGAVLFTSAFLLLR